MLPLLVPFLVVCGVCCIFVLVLLLLNVYAYHHGGVGGLCYVCLGSCQGVFLCVVQQSCPVYKYC